MEVVFITFQAKPLGSRDPIDTSGKVGQPQGVTIYYP